MIVESLYYIPYLSLFDLGIVCIVIPSFLVFPVAHRLCKGRWLSLCSWIDIVSYFVTHAIWFYGFANDFNHRGAGRIQDIVVLGCLYGILVLLRIPFVWRHPEWRTRIATLSLLALISAAVTLTWFVNLAECAD